MADKKRYAFLLLCSLSFELAVVFAQTDDELISEPVAPTQNFFIEETEDGAVFKQKLSWKAIEDILRYEVVLEQKSDGPDAKYVTVDTVKTETNEVVVSLGMGVYRYKVLVYNLLDRLEIESEWYDFSVKKAVQPTLSSSSPSAIYLEEENDGVFTLHGKNFSSETLFSLRKPGKQRDSYRANIMSIDESGRSAKVLFNMDVVDVGVYDVVVTNPGGLNDKEGPTTVKFKKLMDLDISLGYTVPLFLADDVFSEYMGGSVFPLSVMARITFIPIKRRFGYFGIGINPIYTRMTYDTETYSITGNLFLGHVNLVYQLPVIKQRLMLDFHVGGGIAYFSNYMFIFENDIISPPLNSASGSIDIGIAAQYYVKRRFYVELCLNYVKPFLSDMSANMFLPVISAGYQL